MPRDIAPLDKRQWKHICDDMANGPSEEQIKKMDEIGKRVQRMMKGAKYGDAGQELRAQKTT